MLDTRVHSRPSGPALLGGLLIVVGIGLFLLVFFALLPVIQNPVGTYDRWFPTEEPPREAEPGPVATFRWSVAVEPDRDPPRYRLQAEADVRASRAPVAGVTWELGDGTATAGSRVTHDYAAPGNYLVRLIVEDTAGDTATVEALVPVPEAGRTLGVAGFVDGRFGDGVLGDPLSTINGSVDGAVATVGATVRGGVVVLLFGLAVVAAIIVAWRVARLGVLILLGSDTGTNPVVPPRDDRLRVVSGDS